MKRDRVLYGFTVVLACTLNFGFFAGAIDQPEYHHPVGLLLAMIVAIAATIMKYGDPTQIGTLYLATGLVASLHLALAALVWFWRVSVNGGVVDPVLMATIVSLSGGALLANAFSIVVLIGEVLQQGR